MGYLGQVSTVLGGGGYLGEVSLIGGGSLLSPVPDLLGVVTVYYVRTTGVDSLVTDGLTPATAFRTLKYALEQKLPFAFQNGAFVFDITGITETLPPDFAIPSPICTSPVLPFAGGYLGYSGPLTIRADLTLDTTILAGNVASLAADPTTQQQTINLSGAIAGFFLGMVVMQSGVIMGVVKRQVALAIETTASGLVPGVDIELRTPGATLNDVVTLNIVGIHILEGIELLSSVSAGLVCGTVGQYFFCIGCTVAAVTINSPVGGGGLIFLNCFVIAGGAFSGIIGQGIEAFRSFFTGIYFYGYPHGFDFVAFGCGFESCEPIGSNSTFVFPTNGYADIENCEFKAPLTYAIDAWGAGSMSLYGNVVNNAGAGAYRFRGPLTIDAINLPAGVGNAGFGVELLDGAQFGGSVAAIAVTGAGGDVKIGNLAVTTWAAVLAAANNRITDSGANGDGSSAKRTV